MELLHNAVSPLPTRRSIWFYFQSKGPSATEEEQEEEYTYIPMAGVTAGGGDARDGNSESDEDGAEVPFPWLY